MARDLPGGSRSCLGAPIAQGPFQPLMLADVSGFLLQPVVPSGSGQLCRGGHL